MFYRETGQFKTSYEADQAIFPIPQDRYFVLGVVAFAFLVVPFFLNDYLLNALLLPFMIYAIAALGLNILVGYCGQISLGTGGFMAVGAYSAFKLTTAFPELNLILVFLASGLITAFVGLLFGIPSLRIKGFYLAVATLASQFFILWLLNKVPWFYNYDASGQITMPPRTLFGFQLTGAEASNLVRYFFVLILLVLFALMTKNMVRGRLGRAWMAIRDMDIAAELIGIRPLLTKLLAFSVSSFYIGLAGAMMFAIFLGAAEVGEAFAIDQSLLVLFMIIIGGLGSVLGAFLGAAFMTVMPIFMKNFFSDWLGFTTSFAEHVQITLMGALIIFFLIVEPHGLARMWQIAKEKLRLWPFPH